MAVLNEVRIIGRLGRNPDAIKGDGCTLAVAVSESWKDKDGNKKERTDWFRVVVFGSQASFAQKYLTKGAEILVCGKLRANTYEKNGVKHYTMDIMADSVQGLRYPEKDKSQDGKPSKTEPQKAQSDLPPAMVNEDDIPF